jgi:transposase-like protein
MSRKTKVICPKCGSADIKDALQRDQSAHICNNCTLSFGKKITIRWRKSSATFVIYKGQKVLESGFSSQHEAEQWILDRIQEIGQ